MFMFMLMPAIFVIVICDCLTIHLHYKINVFTKSAVTKREQNRGNLKAISSCSFFSFVKSSKIIKNMVKSFAAIAAIGRITKFCNPYLLLLNYMYISGLKLGVQSRASKKTSFPNMCFGSVNSTDFHDIKYSFKLNITLNFSSI